MVYLRSVVFLLALSTSSLASPYGRADCHTAEKLSGPPAGWAKDHADDLNKDQGRIKLRIQLVQEKMHKFHDLAMKIATPGDDLYGNHLSQDTIDSMVAAKQKSKDLVMDWLHKEGLRDLSSVSPRADSVVVEGTIRQIERLLKTEYSSFINSETKDRVVRTLEYSLPNVLKDHVTVVQPTTFFGLRQMRSTISSVRPVADLDAASLNEAEAVAAVPGCSGSSITPACLANLYSFTAAANQSVGLMGIAGFLKQHPVTTDLTTFMNKYAYFANQAEKYTCTTINGGTCPATDTIRNIVEANLDVQYARAITSNIPNIYYSSGGNGPWLGTGENTNEPWLEWLNYMLALPNKSLPNTISISYGDDSATIPVAYANAQCNLFAQLGARGVSVLVASGDSGVGDECTVNGKKQFTTIFPGGCPWVTTVGGTTGVSPEGAWSGGGGGFSEIFARPSYQDATVSTWLANDKTHTAVSPYFNASGRAYPDVSAQATNFLVVLLGSTSAVSGTSAATPTFASVIQLLNSERIEAGKKGLGFLNPWLYGVGASGMNDITAGKITGCSGVIGGAGFTGVSGWDPATGLGTPNYGKMLEISQATA
ncbi:peptidase S8/S53 domain-containing protein [Amylocarpus encephaloides]|uniref:tripeptidyl-peptidase II n=1 Tax=Amylocarpus encephaloides TaxID=45428 RepID=A0A9P8C3G0_9HELO|nr:peptidase S8/S53 domain-containing protein [Amylocarpus encephaloides]